MGDVLGEAPEKVPQFHPLLLQGASKRMADSNFSSNQFQGSDFTFQGVSESEF